jgi:hypothetical protein
MAKIYITVICNCGNSKSVPEDLLLHYPSGEIGCKQLTKERTICNARFTTKEILEKARGGTIADFSKAELVQERLIK